MIVTEHPISPAEQALTSERAPFPFLCWRSIIGGTVAAIGIHLLLTALGVGAGLATFAPINDGNPVATFSIGAAIVWTLCALVALSFGGFVAGRFSHSRHSGFVHGMLVWCLTLIITLFLLSMGTGMVLGGALKVLGEGLGMGGKVAAVGLGEAAKEGVELSGNQLSSFINEAVQSGPTNAAPKTITRATREIGFSLTRLFSPGGDAASAEDRGAAIKALKDHAGMEEGAASQALDAWTASYKTLQAQIDKAKATADQKAREVADKAADNLSSAALWSFFALLAGLLLASIAGSRGAACALRGTVLRDATAKAG